MELCIVNVIMQKPLIHVFRKAVFVMVHLSSFISLKTIGVDMLRMSVLDHFASGGMYVDIPVKRHGKPGIWVNLVSKHLFQLAKILSKEEPSIVISIHQNLFAAFLDPSTNTPFMPNLVFNNVAPLINQFHGIHLQDYHMIDMVSADLLQILISLDTVSAVIDVEFRSCGNLRFESSSAFGTIQINKKLCIENKDGVPSCSDVCDDTQCRLLLKQIYVAKFAKQLVNALINSSARFCWLGIPKSVHQPLIIKFLLANDIYQCYLMFPNVPHLAHIIDQHHPQATVAIHI